MHTRPATPADIPTIATISAAAFQNDELYNFTNPYFRTHQRNFRDYFLRRARIRFWTPGFVFYVAETDPWDSPPPPRPPPSSPNPDNDGDETIIRGAEGGEVVGYALYHPHPPAGTRTLLPSSPPYQKPYTAFCERTLNSLHETYISLLRLDRSVDPARAALWRIQQSHAFDRFWAEQGPVGNEDGRGYFTLQNLCVDPTWQRRGVGKRLIEVGQKEARREGVKVVLTSSEVGARLYTHMGFERIGELRIEGWRRGGKRWRVGRGRKRRGREIRGMMGW
ncbi:MAG: hypothetical protein OHK93_000022 [Ramalina farinacea]|uniref:N-acetyltransferase domain-containing protein n=1 Tax=Ramalina farinacea TaxID=258253 RepID=A0AA43QE47_9LECA|nr:hypothetical protein [Ramalina farinacea]